MSNFKKGEKIVCIDNKNGAEELEEKQIYTIAYIVEDNQGRSGFILREFGKFDAYYSWRFRKLDYDFAENLLKEISESVNQKHLQN